MPLLQSLKALLKQPKRCGACLFELDPQAKSLTADVDIFVGSAFSSSDTHTVSYESFVASSARGCEKCAAILKAVAQQGLSFQTAHWSHYPRSSGHGPYLNLVEPQVLFELCTSAPVPEDRFSRMHMCLWNGAKVSGSTSDSASFEQIASWMDTCRTQHARCQLASEFVPTRLIYLPDDDNSTLVHLVEKPPSCAYAALSHRWTPETQTSRLEKTNLAPRLALGIHLDQLPQTMQDAIRVARALNIRYIWIDSMCIIQDSKEDWLREAATMASIYKHAELTIAASWCSQPGQSIFSTRDATSAATDVTSFDGQPVFLRRLKPHFTWQDIEYGWFKDDPYVDAEAEWPLLSRGWVYQEQLLSRRMLHFTRDEVIWECNEHTACECRPTQTKDPMAVRMVKKPVTSKRWGQVVREYAKRDLTFQADRLPALAGIAKSFVGTGEDVNKAGKYLCGLWAEDLSSCFFWYVSGQKSPRPGTKMPSWSWASTSGSLEIWDSSVDYVEFKGHKVVYGGDEHMGDVKEAEITLAGRVVRSTAIWDHADDAQGCAFGVVFEGQRIKVRADYAWDAEGEWLVGDGSSVVMLLFGQSTHGSFDPETGSVDRVLAACLVLRCVDESRGLYERIGVTLGEGMDGDGYMDFEKFKEMSENITMTVV